MEPSRLSRDELEYELRVRGIKNVEAIPVSEMRKSLSGLLKEEPIGTLIVDPDCVVDLTEEITICTQKIVELESAALGLTRPVKESECRRTNAKLCHLFGRLARITTNDANFRAGKKNLQQQLEVIESTILSIFDADQESTPTPATATNTVLPATSKQTPVAKWNLVFSGEEADMSVNAFIERVNEYSISRNVSCQELFNSAVELFRSNALIWYRANRNKFSNWAELVSLLRAEYEPHDYGVELWKEIRARTQGVDERVGNYFACMANLFQRLPIWPREDEKLQVLRRNITPYFIYGIGLTEITTVDELQRVCKQLETNKYMAEKFQPSPPGKRVYLEPDLAYNNRNRTPRVNAASDSVAPLRSSRCWNCQSTTHKFSNCSLPRNRFCYGCGYKDVIKSKCPKCSKNA